MTSTAQSSLTQIRKTCHIQGKVTPNLFTTSRWTKKGVEKLLHDLNPEKAAGPDNISPRVIKGLSGVLSKPLSIIFQHAIDLGIVPTQWKSVLVTPIFKKGDKHSATNYHPVSLTAVCCKFCEHIIAKVVINHLEICSCETQLLLFIDKLAQSMCDGQPGDVAVMDFSEAFSMVPYERLFVKLEYSGMQGRAPT